MVGESIYGCLCNALKSSDCGGVKEAPLKQTPDAKVHSKETGVAD